MNIMKKEDKELLLKDLCARLPYGVKIKTSYDKMNEPIEVRFINPRNESFAVGGNFTLISGLDFDKYDCKPYLFPLSSMTEEQKVIYGDLCYAVIHSLAWDMQAALNELVDWFNKNHFDYRDLISKGLAIDATDLNIY